jgi:ATP-dependent protease Clp ATPase subunit
LLQTLSGIDEPSRLADTIAAHLGVRLADKQRLLEAIDTGARGLRTIGESVMLDTMYDLPSVANVSKVVVDESVIEHKTDPYLIYQTPPAVPKVASAE